MKKTNKFVIAVYVDNKYGVLTRVTSMFTRRGFNIDALTVGETESPEYSRITICMSGDGYAKEQLINQLRKLYNVKKVEEVEEGSSIKRELGGKWAFLVVLLQCGVAYIASVFIYLILNLLGFGV